MTVWTSPVNFEGFSLAFKDQSGKIKYLGLPKAKPPGLLSPWLCGHENIELCNQTIYPKTIKFVKQLRLFQMECAKIESFKQTKDAGKKFLYTVPLNKMSLSLSLSLSFTNEAQKMFGLICLPSPWKSKKSYSEYCGKAPGQDLNSGRQMERQGL